MVFGLDFTKFGGFCRGSKKKRDKGKNKERPKVEEAEVTNDGASQSHHSEIGSSYHSATMGSMSTEGTLEESTMNLPQGTTSRAASRKSFKNPPLEGAMSQSDLEIGTGYVTDDSGSIPKAKQLAIQVKSAYKGGDQSRSCDCNCCWFKCVSGGWTHPTCYCKSRKGEDGGEANAEKLHNWTAGPPALNYVDIKVPRGSIYCLLGPSGCGKKDLLKCILGLKKLDEGSISIFGKPPLGKGYDIGYLPQDISLYKDFSTKEMVSYYANVVGVNAKDYKEKFDYLFEMLELPCPNKRIKKLSLSQQRRVSFIVAVIFSPDLLVLDEPTTGMDPVIRKYIWRYLKQSVKDDGTTILIVTHYAEEARNADIVGVMRNGKMLVEAAPGELVKNYGSNILDDVVMRLTVVLDYNGMSNTNIAKDNVADPDADKNLGVASTTGSEAGGYSNSNNSSDFSRVNDISSSKNDGPNNGNTEPLEDFFLTKQELGNNSRCSPLRRLYALTWKNLLLMFRNWIWVLFLIFTPALLMVILLTVIGHDPIAVPIGIINQENKLESCLSFPKNNYSAMKCVDDDPVNFDKKDISCQFLAEMNQDMIKLTKYDTEHDAVDAVKHGKIRGFFLFPPSFSENVWERLASGFQVREDISNMSSIQMTFDRSDKQIYMYLVQEARDALIRLGKGYLKTCDKDPKLIEQPLILNTPIYGSKDTDFREFIAPGVLLAVIFFFPMCSSAITYLYDKRQGTLKRGLVAGIQLWEIVVSFFFTEIIILLVQLLIVFFVLSIPYQIEIKGCYFLAIFIAFLTGLAGMSLGFLVSTIAKEEIEAVLVVLLVTLPGAAISGILWPLDGMCVILRYVAYIYPNTWSNEALRSIVTRGWGIEQMEVWLGIAVPVAWIAVFWIATAYIMKCSRFRF